MYEIDHFESLEILDKIILMNQYYICMLMLVMYMWIEVFEVIDYSNLKLVCVDLRKSEKHMFWDYVVRMNSFISLIKIVESSCSPLIL
jgi:hypothetical protein